MKETGIEWCDCTLNPVVGCKQGCPYCYARRMNERFGFADDFSEPEFFPDRLRGLSRGKPRSVFMDSMSDIAWWEPEWTKEAGDAIRNRPEHDYIFLTKHSERLNAFCPLLGDQSGNVFCGVTVTDARMASLVAQTPDAQFISAEPLLDDPTWIGSVLDRLPNVSTVIVGCMTGPSAVPTKREWVERLVRECTARKAGVFMKPSIEKLMGSGYRRGCVPWHLSKEREAEMKKSIYRSSKEGIMREPPSMQEKAERKGR
jgi:protein gp37